MAYHPFFQQLFCTLRIFIAFKKYNPLGVGGFSFLIVSLFGALTLLLYFSSRPDIALLWFLIPFKAAKHLMCDQYRWLTIKIVTVLLLLAILAVFLYNMPGYMVKKMLGAWIGFWITGILHAKPSSLFLFFFLSYYCYYWGVAVLKPTFVCWFILKEWHQASYLLLRYMAATVPTIKKKKTTTTGDSFVWWHVYQFLFE